MESKHSITTVLLPSQTRVAWSKDQQAFVQVEVAASSSSSASSDNANNRSSKDSSAQKRTSHQLRTTAKSSQEPRNLVEAALDEFVAHSEELSDHDNGDDDDPVEELLALRRELLDQILHQQPLPQHPSHRVPSSSLRLLPVFLTCWRQALDHILQRHNQLRPDLDTVTQSPALMVTVCRELHQLAETAMLLGDVPQARSALGQCIQLARHHQLDPDIVGDAKRVLLECIRFREQLTRCTNGLQRHNPPVSLLRSVLRILTDLRTMAPSSVELMRLHASALLDMQRFRDVLTSLAHFAFTAQDGALTLLYANALEYEGYYNDSIAVATAYCGSQITTEDHETRELMTVLMSHSHALTAILTCKTKAEDALFVSHFDAAEVLFSDALLRTQTKSYKLRAALLLGRANARIGLEWLLSARRDLEESVALDSGNQLSRLRLRTVELAMERQQIYRSSALVRRRHFTTST